MPVEMEGGGKDGVEWRRMDWLEKDGGDKIGAQENEKLVCRIWMRQRRRNRPGEGDRIGWGCKRTAIAQLYVMLRNANM